MQSAPPTIDVSTGIASRWQRRDEGDLHVVKPTQRSFPALALRDDHSVPVGIGSRKPRQLGERYDNITKPTYDEIAVCAYSIWQQEERPTERALDHWLQAELQLVVASLLLEKATVDPTES